MTTPTTPEDRFRDTVDQLFREFNAKLDKFVDKVDMRLDGFGRDMQEMRDKLTRMEAQDQPAKVAKLENDLKAANEKFDQYTRDSAASSAKIVADAADARTKLEGRLTRMEVIIAPLTVGGSALLAAVIGAVFTALSGHIK